MKNMKQIITVVETVKINSDFDIVKLSKKVLKETLSVLKVMYDVSVSVSVVSPLKIKSINKSERHIDKITDVLSFPNIDFRKPNNFKDFIDKNYIDVSIVDLSTKTIYLGDVVINKDFAKTKYQYVLLLTHSILHLLGYDHATKKDEINMFKLQDKVLFNLKIYKE